MYVGRLLVVAPGAGAYRVSSRSFPNRQVVARSDALTVAPTANAEPTDNPYVSYNCVRVVGGGVDDHRDGEDDGLAEPLAVVGNGSHVDPVAEKLERGYPPRDALAGALLALDYEKDDYDTPRIAGVVAAESAWVGTVRRDALLVRETSEPTLVATYERDSPEAFSPGDDGLPADPEAAARAVYDLDFEHPVCAAGVVVDDGDVRTGFHNGD